jgi:hypothetical protein
MSKPRHRLWDTTSNRCLTDAETAFYLGMSEGGLAGKRQALEREGFPVKDTLMGRTDKALIDLWLDARGGLLSPDAPASNNDGTDNRLAEFANGSAQH